MPASRARNAPGKAAQVLLSSAAMDSARSSGRPGKSLVAASPLAGLLGCDPLLIQDTIPWHLRLRRGHAADTESREGLLLWWIPKHWRQR